MDERHLLAGLSIAISLIQFGSLIGIMLWLRKQRQLKKQAPSLPQASALVSQWATVPTFNASINAEWRKRAPKPDPNGKDDNIESKNHLEEGGGVELDTEDGDDGHMLRVDEPIPDTQKAIANIDLKELRNTNQIDDSLVLPIYYKFLILQAIHCFLWVVICVVLVALGADFLQWGNVSPNAVPHNKFAANPPYYIGTGLLIGVGAALLDGVAVFLAQESVGRKSIQRSHKFAFGWGIFNALTCTVLSAVGHAPSRYDAIRDMYNIPWWDPFFDRICLMWLFNIVLLVGVCFTRRKQQRRQDEQAEATGKPRKFRSRNTWIMLAIFNISGSSILAGLYVSFQVHDGYDFVYRLSQAATWLLTAFMLFFLGYTPILYYSLLMDSRYWRESWVGALSSIKTPLLAHELHNNSDDEDPYNIVIDMNALEYKQMMGRGGFSTVYRGTVWTSLQLQVAIKVLHVQEMTKEVVERFLEEVRIFVRFRHPNVVHFVGACISPPDFAIVMELCKPNSLADLLKDYNKRIHALMEEERVRLRKQRERTGRGKQDDGVGGGGGGKRKDKHNNDDDKRNAIAPATMPNNMFGVLGGDDTTLVDRYERKRVPGGGGGGGGGALDYLDLGVSSGGGGNRSRNSTKTGGKPGGGGGGKVEDHTNIALDRDLHKLGPRTAPTDGDMEQLMAHSPTDNFSPLGVIKEGKEGGGGGGGKEVRELSTRRRDTARKTLTPDQRPRPKEKPSFLNGGYPKLYTMQQAVDIALAIADAMKYMHACQILHRDLKSSNILFDTHDRPKICDFGLSREQDKVTEANSFAGTIAYMSPEVLRLEKVTAKSDVYSYAVIFWELLTSKLAWTKYSTLTPDLEPIPRPRPINPLVIMEKVAHHKARPPINDEDHIHPVLHVLLREMWADDQDLRPPFEEIVDRLETFRRSQHFQRFGDQAMMFGERDVTKWLKG